MLHKIFKGIAPVAALVLGAGLSACDGRSFNTGETDGVPLAELDMSGDPPHEVVLAGPDTVLIIDGAALDIDVEGDPGAVDALRFSLEEGTLGIMRENREPNIDGRAIVRVTMPSPRALVLAGSGQIEADSLVGDASVTIAGTGEARTRNVDADKLAMTLAGTGTYAGQGEARDLELTIAGSGTADMRGLQVERADVTIAGSGDATFASDGTVDASIMGSGEVTVVGRARCTVSVMGSGRLHCETGAAETAAQTGAAPEPPAAPAAPENPIRPEPAG